MVDQQMVTIRGSILTAVWCWLTKMIVQSLTCIPFVLFMLYVFPELAEPLSIRLLIYSIILATIATILMMLSSVRADSEGLSSYIMSRRIHFIAWNEIAFKS